MPRTSIKVRSKQGVDERRYDRALAQHEQAAEDQEQDQQRESQNFFRAPKNSKSSARIDMDLSF